MGWKMNDDMALVREYVANQSERAFETLVARHVTWFTRRQYGKYTIRIWLRT